MNFIILVLVIGVMTATLVAVSTDATTTVFGLVGLFGCLAYLALQAKRAHRQLSELHRMRAAYEQLDQQAKLIIRTDLELHHAQEELDRRLASLMSLHRLGQQLQVSLRPDEVFTKLDVPTVTNFGFSKGLLGICPSLDALEWRALIGVSAPIAQDLQTHLVKSGLVKHILTAPAPQVVQATSATDPLFRRLLDVLAVQTAVVAGIMPHTGPAGCLILGRIGGSATNTTADQELAGVLANQLAAAVENSALFEETWASKVDLERKVRERTHELAAANTQLQHLNKAKSDFVSAVSHELRTPLAAVKGYASLLATGQFGKPSAAQAERLAKIEKHADALTQLINNLLDIARIESGRITMERRRIAAEELLTAAYDTVRPQLEAKHIRYVVDRDGVQQMTGDAQHLQRVFVNLLSNAVKYTPEGGEIRVGLRQEAGSVLATVSDTGCGIAPEELPKLFQEFYRASDPVNQQVRGTGLGLVLVKRIVEAHQGRIWVESAPGKGSTFSVSLPVG
jgi:signal transduction histidine kinase